MKYTWLVAAVAGCLLTSCRLFESDREKWIDWSPIWVAGRHAMMQSRPATLLAFEPGTGQAKWHFGFPEYELPGIAEAPARRLVCEPASLDPETLIIRSEREVFLVAAGDGSLRHRLPAPAAEEFGSRFCPAPLGGGMWLQLEEGAGDLVAFDTEGKRLWSLALPQSAARGRPQRIGSSDRAVLKTADFLLWIDRSGRLLRKEALARYSR